MKQSTRTTAGEIRKLGIDVPSYVPDCATAEFEIEIGAAVQNQDITFSWDKEFTIGKLPERICLRNSPMITLRFIEPCHVLHPETNSVVDNAVIALKDKLLKAQIKHGLTNGWRNPPEGVEGGGGRFFVTKEQCLEAFHSHLAKGDALDCIAYLIYLRELGYEGSLSPVKEI